MQSHQWITAAVTTTAQQEPEQHLLLDESGACQNRIQATDASFVLGRLIRRNWRMTSATETRPNTRDYIALSLTYRAHPSAGMRENQLSTNRRWSVRSNRFYCLFFRTTHHSPQLSIFSWQPFLSSDPLSVLLLTNRNKIVVNHGNR